MRKSLSVSNAPATARRDINKLDESGKRKRCAMAQKLLPRAAPALDADESASGAESQ
ncbi:DeoR family transcriptional regulator [Escherichia coli]